MIITLLSVTKSRFLCNKRGGCHLERDYTMTRHKFYVLRHCCCSIKIETLLVYSIFFAKSRSSRVCLCMQTQKGRKRVVTFMWHLVAVTTINVYYYCQEMVMCYLAHLHIIYAYKETTAACSSSCCRHVCYDSTTKTENNSLFLTHIHFIDSLSTNKRCVKLPTI